MLKRIADTQAPLQRLITVQDNTMLKRSIASFMRTLCLITVQDNTMLKL